jgi:hypothetical protein
VGHTPYRSFNGLPTASLSGAALDGGVEERICMGLFRTHRPLLVDANQCKAPMTIQTDGGVRHVQRGDWIVRGEGGECYVVDDAFFKRTFRPDRGAEAYLEQEGRHYGC